MILIRPVFFLLGFILGYLIPVLDLLIFAFFLYPEVAVSHEVFDHLRNRRFTRLFAMLGEGRDGLKLMHRKAVFFGALCLTSLFLMTSSRSLVGFGVMLGLEFHLVQGMLRQISHIETLRSMYFWDIAPTASGGVIRQLVFGMLVLFGLTALAVLAVV